MSIIKTMQRIERGARLQANIMRDPLRTGGWQGAEKVADAFEDIADRALDALAHPETPVSTVVAIKPLEWVEHGDAGLEWHRATPPIGSRYNIEDDGFSAKKLTVTVGDLVLGNFDHVDEAKAAAQTDYEARIRSALALSSKEESNDDAK